MTSPRRGTGVVLTSAVLLLTPVGTGAQCSGWNTSLYADAWHSPNEWSVIVYAEGVDYDSGCCYHEYGLSLSSQHSSNAESTGAQYLGGGGGGMAGAISETVTVTGSSQWYVDFYVACYCLWTIVGFEGAQGQVEVQNVPQLRLVLDEDGNFDHLNPSDDAPSFVPGTYYGGPSRPVAEMRDTGQIVRAIAFFADAANPALWVAPPLNVNVTFSLDDTTAWTGFATNAGWTSDPANPDPRDSAPDYSITPVDGGPETSSLEVGFADGNVAAVALRVRDYGGRTRVRALASTSAEAALSLPRDENNNWLPERWWTGRDGTRNGY